MIKRMGMLCELWRDRLASLRPHTSTTPLPVNNPLTSHPPCAVIFVDCRLGLHVGWYANNCICAEKGYDNPNEISAHMKNTVRAIVDLGYDSVKLDGCGQFRNLTWWAELLNATIRPVMIENCHWGQTIPGDTTGDAPCSGLGIGDEDVSDCPYNFFRTR